MVDILDLSQSELWMLQKEKVRSQSAEWPFQPTPASTAGSISIQQESVSDRSVLDTFKHITPSFDEGLRSGIDVRQYVSTSVWVLCISVSRAGGYGTWLLMWALLLNCDGELAHITSVTFVW